MWGAFTVIPKEPIKEWFISFLLIAETMIKAHARKQAADRCVSRLLTRAVAAPQIPI
jgi:hypothetical protein